MKKGLIAIDFDGTLILKHDGITLAKENAKAIEVAHSLGYLIAIVTGRNTKNVTMLMDDLGLSGIIDIIVGCNGAEYFDINKDAEVEVIASIKKADAEEILEIVKDVDLAVIWNDNETVFCTPNNPRLPDLRQQSIFPFKIIERDQILDNFPHEVSKMVFILLPDKQVDIKELVYKNKKRDYDLFYTDTDMLEMAAGGINKGLGFHEILLRNNIAQKDTMAIGDHDNDREMLLESGYAVAMGNAIEELKDIADYVTSSLEDFGVAEAIYHYLKLREEIQ